VACNPSGAADTVRVMSLKIATWNVNSLKARADFVSLYLDAEAPDVLCLQELKLPEDKVPREMFESRGYHLAIHGQPQWNGVLIASRTPIEEVHCGLPVGDEGQSRLVAATTAGIRFVNLYCPQGQSVDSPKFAYKLGFFRALNAWLREDCDPAAGLVVLGDINIAPTTDDIWDAEKWAGTPSFHPDEHELYGQLLDFGLSDAVAPHIEPGTYSFWDYRAGKFRFNQGMRIDHILVSASLRGRVSGAVIQRPWRKKKEGLTPSDHAPVEVTLG
jgi:exodeoxyribonuclease III